MILPETAVFHVLTRGDNKCQFGSLGSFLEGGQFFLKLFYIIT
jgi:hypothetical protein